MKNVKIKSLLWLPINGILFALVSLLNTFNENISQLEIAQIIRPMIVCIFFIAILGIFAYFLWHSIPRTSFIVFILSVIFFSYGHILVLLEDYKLFGFAKHRILIPIVLILIAFLVLIIKNIKESQITTINRLITNILGFLFIFNIATTGFGLYTNSQIIDNQGIVQHDLPVLSFEQQKNLPDIYWIILDGYERKDALLDHYGFDNSDFMNELSKRGFIIPECSLSNYTLTGLSLSTAINMDYLEHLSTKPMIEKDQLEFRLFRSLITNSKVRKILTNYGYKTIAFKTEFVFTELRDADYFIQPPQKSFTENLIHPVFDVFEEEFFGTTIIKLVFDMPTPMKRNLLTFIGTPVKDKYDLVQFNFAQLEEVPKIDSRKFVFVHLLPNHEPFVLNEQGEFEYFENKIEGFKSSLPPTNAKMLQIVDQIILNSSIPPVIVIQGDHAYSDKEKTKILNAYFLPGIDTSLISKNISPVNTFRLILENYFGLDLPQLENRSYQSPTKFKPLDFVLDKPSCY